MLCSIVSTSTMRWLKEGLLSCVIVGVTVFFYAEPESVSKRARSITIPLQMIEFNLILKAAKAPIGSAGFWILLN